RAIERQSRAKERRELARQREHQVARNFFRLEQPPTRTLRRGRRCAREAVRSLRDLRWHQPLLAQALDDLRFRRAVEFAGRNFAARRYGAITEYRHRDELNADSRANRISSRASRAELLRTS